MSTSRTGRIDQVDDLAELDLVAFNDGVNPWDPSPFMKGGFAKGVDYFRDEVQRWGFAGLGHVIDVGSGYGRWSLFLAEVNDQVTGVERNKGGAEVGQRLASHVGLHNLDFRAEDVLDIQAGKATYDGAWCNNVVQFVPRGRMLGELHRVLKPGGKLFLGVANSAGRVLEKFFEGFAAGGHDHRTTMFAIESLRSGPAFDGRPNFTTPSTIASTLDGHGFSLDENYPLEATHRGKGLPADEMPKDLRDLEQLGHRLGDDRGFAERFARDPSVAGYYPLNVQVRAIRK